jgi:hypothetical protein
MNWNEFSNFVVGTVEFVLAEQSRYLLLSIVIVNVNWPLCSF